MDIKGKLINVLGDSISAGSGVSDKSLMYNHLLESEAGAIMHNFSVGGTRIADFISDKLDEGAYCQRALKMDDDADIYIVFGGTNDYGHGNAPLGKLGDKEKSTFYGALDRLINILIEKNPKATIVFMTPIHRLNENTRLPEAKTAEDYKLKQFVDAIREVCEVYSIPVVDLWKESGFNPCVSLQKAMYIPDGLHPNEAGHRLIYNRLVGKLQTL